jgi:hypothetical protein
MASQGNKLIPNVLFEEGRYLWIEYENLNGYAFRPNEEGLKRLSRLLDLNVPYIRRCINTFLGT